MRLITQFFVLSFVLFIQCCSLNPPSESKVPPNVLLLFVDDLRPELSCYDHPIVQSPHIDKLASGGVLFERAYCNIPVCGASRASMLTGVRPARGRFITYHTYADEDLPGVTCLPQHFKDHGYYTISNGKIFHQQDDRAEAWDENWRPEPVSTWRDYQLAENIQLDTTPPKRGPAYEAADVHDTAYFDGKLADKAIRDLQQLKARNQPFFLAVGFYKPHLPFNAPKKYWDKYPLEQIQLPDNPDAPENVPKQAIHKFGELRAYQDIPAQGSVSDSMARKLIQGYYASVSYTDAQVGRLLDQLENLELDDNTIVLLLGDHGWNLLEHGLWCKHSNFRTSLRTALVMRGPGITSNAKANGLVEFVDLYPTLCELTGLPLPDHLDGRSLVPLLEDPGLPGKEQVIAKWYDGYTYKSDRYAYTEWRDSNAAVYARMLYDHREDPEENVNISETEAGGIVIEEIFNK